MTNDIGRVRSTDGPSLRNNNDYFAVIFAAGRRFFYLSVDRCFGLWHYASILCRQTDFVGHYSSDDGHQGDAATQSQR